MTFWGLWSRWPMAALLVACSPEPGPRGEAGPAGPPGERGPSGAPAPAVELDTYIVEATGTDDVAAWCSAGDLYTGGACWPTLVVRSGPHVVDGSVVGHRCEGQAEGIVASAVCLEVR